MYHTVLKKTIRQNTQHSYLLQYSGSGVSVIQPKQWGFRKENYKETSV